MAGLMQDTQLVLGDSLSIMEDLTNTTSVGPSHHTHTCRRTLHDDTCVCSRWRCLAVTWISGAPC